MTPEQQQAAQKLINAIKASFPDIDPTAEDGPFGPQVKLGVAAGRLPEVEAAVQSVTAEIMLDTGVIIMLVA